jgi:hypothetical protein
MTIAEQGHDNAKLSRSIFSVFFPILNESNLPLGLGRFPIGGNAQMFPLQKS